MTRVIEYLVSTGIIRHPYLGTNVVELTTAGVAHIERGQDNPTVATAPFQAFSVVINDAGANNQIAVGQGSFAQTNSHLPAAELRTIISLVEDAMNSAPKECKNEIYGALNALKGEQAASAPDADLIRASLKKSVE